MAGRLCRLTAGLTAAGPQPVPPLRAGASVIGVCSLRPLARQPAGRPAPVTTGFVGRDARASRAVLPRLISFVVPPAPVMMVISVGR